MSGFCDLGKPHKPTILDSEHTKLLKFIQELPNHFPKRYACKSQDLKKSSILLVVCSKIVDILRFGIPKFETL